MRDGHRAENFAPDYAKRVCSRRVVVAAGSQFILTPASYLKQKQSIESRKAYLYHAPAKRLPVSVGKRSKETENKYS